MQMMSKMMMAVMMVILMLLVASVAFAAEQAGQGVAQAFTGVIIPILQAFATATIPILAAWLAKTVRQKTQIQISRETEDFITESAIKSVHYVEELATTAAKNGATKWASSTKLGAAVDKLLIYCPTLTTDQAIEKVHEAIGMIPGLGASAAIPAAAPAE